MLTKAEWDNLTPQQQFTLYQIASVEELEAKVVTDDAPPVSDEEILELRAQGLTYKQIGEKYGRSPAWANRRVRTHEWREQRKTRQDFKVNRIENLAVDTIVFNSLRRTGIKTIAQTVELLSKPNVKVRGLGDERFRQLRNAVREWIAAHPDALHDDPEEVEEPRVSTPSQFDSIRYIFTTYDDGVYQTVILRNTP